MCPGRRSAAAGHLAGREFCGRLRAVVASSSGMVFALSASASSRRGSGESGRGDRGEPRRWHVVPLYIVWVQCGVNEGQAGRGLHDALCASWLPDLVLCRAACMPCRACGVSATDS